MSFLRRTNCCSLATVRRYPHALINRYFFI